MITAKDWARNFHKLGWSYRLEHIDKFIADVQADAMKEYTAEYNYANELLVKKNMLVAALMQIRLGAESQGAHTGMSWKEVLEICKLALATNDVIREEKQPQWITCKDCDGDEGTRGEDGEWINCESCDGDGGHNE